MRNAVAPRLIFAFYVLVLMLPIYWLINMSLRTNEDIVSGLALYPHHPTLEKYIAIFHDPTYSVTMALHPWIRDDGVTKPDFR